VVFQAYVSDVLQSRTMLQAPAGDWIQNLYSAAAVQVGTPRAFTVVPTACGDAGLSSRPTEVQRGVTAVS
jgi:hypothetical protein